MRVIRRRALHANKCGIYKEDFEGVSQLMLQYLCIQSYKAFFY